MTLQDRIKKLGLAYVNDLPPEGRQERIDEIRELLQSTSPVGPKEEGTAAQDGELTAEEGLPQEVLEGLVADAMKRRTDGVKTPFLDGLPSPGGLPAGGLMRPVFDVLGEEIEIVLRRRR